MLRTVEEALQFVEENDVKFIRLTFCDIFGMQKNISIMPNELPHAFRDGIPFEASAVSGFMSEVSSELLLFPDPNTLAFLPWRPSTGRVVRVFCKICYPDGTPYLGDGRFMLKQASKRLQAANLECKLGTECEFYLLELEEDGSISKRPNDHAGYLDVAPLDKGEDVRRQICLYLEEMGIQPKTSHHERGPGQNEIDFKASDPMTAADDFLSFKNVVKTVANYNGLYASMLPKPFADQYGCGLHIHFTLFEDGENIFCANSKGQAKARHFIAGILNRISEITLFLNSLTNSYARFGSFEAPAYISWSDTSRFQLISFPVTDAKSVHMELRSPDSCLNPYLAFALLLNAGLEGIEQQLPLGEPLQVDSHADEDEGLPHNLAEAIAAAENSDFVKSVITPHILQMFVAAKREEWQQYSNAADKQAAEDELYFGVY
jgi:glutamine synthetase